MITSKQQVQISTVLRDLGEQVSFSHVAVMQAAQGAPVTLLDVAGLLSKAHANLNALSGTLREAGVIVPVKPKTDDNNLGQLAALDTPDTRRLLALLEEAQEIAERVDAARGNAVDEELPLLPGESRGTDLAELISVLALRLRREVGGARSPHE